MTTSLKKEVNEVCNLAEGIREKAEKKGQKLGEKIGQERGEKIGEKRAALETRIDVALNLMKSLKMSAEDVLIAMSVPARSRATLLKSINERLAAPSRGGGIAYKRRRLSILVVAAFARWVASDGAGSVLA